MPVKLISAYAVWKISVIYAFPVADEDITDNSGLSTRNIYISRRAKTFF